MNPEIALTVFERVIILLMAVAIILISVIAIQKKRGRIERLFEFMSLLCGIVSFLVTSSILYSNIVNGVHMLGNTLDDLSRVAQILLLSNTLIHLILSRKRG